MYNFEQFLREVWEQVSPQIVSDRFWSNNHEYMVELTYNLFRIYERTSVKVGDEEHPVLPIKIWAAIFEGSVSASKKFVNKKRP